MSIGALRQLLELVEPDRELWHIAPVRTVHAREICRLTDANGDFAERFRDRNVALLAYSEAQLVPLLVLLDGVCRQLTLVPNSLSADRIRSIVLRSQSEFLMATEDASASSGDFRTCRVDVELLWENRLARAEMEMTSQTPTRWVLTTSGTTGEPKLVSHTLASLTRTVKCDCSRGKDYRWGSLYNLTGFAGLQVFLQSWLAGSCLILGTPQATLQQRVSELAEARCSALSATPTMWRKLLMSCPVDKLPLKQITLGGEVVDQKILDALRIRFPKANVVHIYASTEAGVGFAVRDGKAGFPASFLAHPPTGLRLTVDEQSHLLLRSDTDEQEYLNHEAPLKRDDGFIDTGDVVIRQGDRYFFAGRADGTINVGGNKVHPEEVEAFLLGCDGVRFARVSSRKSPFTGSLVQAEVVPEISGIDREEFRKLLVFRCRAELEPYKVPAVIRIVESLEMTESGKMKRE